MLDFKIYNDYELIYYIKEGSEAALVFLIKKYEPLIKKLATVYIGFSDKKEDLVQEGYLILLKCIEKYDDRINCVFYSYFIVSLRRHYIKLMQDEYYTMPVLAEEASYNTIKEDIKNFKGSDFFTDPIKISIFDSCIMGDISIRRYSIDKNIPYKKCLQIYEDIKNELKLKYYNIDTK